MSNIQDLYNRVHDKKGFLQELSKRVDRSEKTIQTTWMSEGRIPDHFEEVTHTLLINWLKAQIQGTNRMIGQK